jgi:hypothetical protein
MNQDLSADDLAQNPIPGEYVTTVTTSQEVVSAAVFAIAAQQQALQQQPDTASAQLTLISIQAAAQQIVAGINYRLDLKVNLNGEEKTAVATVWRQAWRSPDLDQLTAWDWQ